MNNTRCLSCFKNKTIEKFDSLYFIGDNNMCIKCGIKRIKKDHTFKKQGDYKVNSNKNDNEDLIKLLCNKKELFKEVCRYCDSTLDDDENIICRACEYDGCNYRI